MSQFAKLRNISQRQARRICAHPKEHPAYVRTKEIDGRTRVVTDPEVISEWVRVVHKKIR